MRFGTNAATSLSEPSYNNSSDQSTAFERTRTSNSSEVIRSQTTRSLKREKVVRISDALHTSTSGSRPSTDTAETPNRSKAGKSDWLSNWDGV